MVDRLKGKIAIISGGATGMEEQPQSFLLRKVPVLESWTVTAMRQKPQLPKSKLWQARFQLLLPMFRLKPK